MTITESRTLVFTPKDSEALNEALRAKEELEKDGYQLQEHAIIETKNAYVINALGQRGARGGEREKKEVEDG